MRAIFMSWLLICWSLVPNLCPAQQTGKLEQRQFTYSAFPILMYDSDIGFGYGGKGTVKNVYQKNESFDLILFNSSKGEQWYVFTFSMPDFELRQGERYPLAYDLRLEYDKRIKSNFFGIGNDSRDNDYQFTKEFVKLELTLSRAFTRQIIGELGYRFTSYSVYDFDLNWSTITHHTPGAGESLVSLVTTRLRWDTRDSQIHPHKGFRAFYALEFCPAEFGGDWDFTKHRLELSAYKSLIGSHILAARLWLQSLAGSAPYLEMGKIGDSWTARGYKADRFLDKAMVLTTLEYRFPILWRLGGVLFTDAGRVSAKLNKLTLQNWHSNWGWGLRYYLANFVVRMDVGKSSEGTRLFFQFGHVF